MVSKKKPACVDKRYLKLIWVSSSAVMRLGVGALMPARGMPVPSGKEVTMLTILVHSLAPVTLTAVSVNINALLSTKERREGQKQ